jgi:hypothetical protein
MEREKLESAATKYAYLRGLFGIPIGLLFILSALANWEVGPLRELWTFPVVALAVGALCLPINRYYNEHYGKARPSAKQHAQGIAVVLFCLVMVLGGSTLLRSEASWSLDLPVNTIAVTFGLVMLISFGVAIGVQTHHVIIWGLLVLAGALPVWNGADPSNIGMVMAGVAAMASGVLDHRLFVATFGSAGLVGVGRSDVGT